MTRWQFAIYLIGYTTLGALVGVLVVLAIIGLESLL